MKINRILLLSWLLMLASPSIAMEKSYYILRSTNPTSNMQQHASEIDLLIPQAYQIAADGNVSGFINPNTLAFANQHHIKVMALVTNAGFDKDKAHAFLQNKSAQRNAITFLLAECQKHALHGLQFDFEGVKKEDKYALTYFLTLAYNELHQRGFAVSFAVIPDITKHGALTDYQKRRDDDWIGAYDLKELAKHCDFITLMTYDQHQDGTTPGPFASYPWVDAAIKHALVFVPANKLSLGIPSYSGRWYLGGLSASHKIFVNLSNIDYKTVQSIITKNHIKLQWDPVNKIHYAIYQRHWLNEFLFVEDAMSFQAKLQLVKKYHLRGFSVFAIGNEDARDWEVVK